MKAKILIVEDELAITENIRYALETEGFEPFCHATGGEALSFLQNQTVDLILLDVGLPDTNGFELCKTILKSHPVPIIFLTARSEEIDRVVGLEIGADDYVVKPFSPRELCARVRAVLRRSNQNGNPLGDTPHWFQVDEKKRRISYASSPLALSRTEYEILRTFIRHPGHVFSRERIMELVWDEPEVSMDRTVDAHIKNIRRKLKLLRPELDPISTHRGVGYSLKEDP